MLMLTGAAEDSWSTGPVRSPAVLYAAPLRAHGPPGAQHLPAGLHTGQHECADAECGLRQCWPAWL